MEELEEKNESLQDQVAELKDEIEKLQSGKSGGAGAANESVSKTAEDPYLKEELHQVKLELKDANTENKELKKQLQDMKVDLQGTKSELTLANNQRDASQTEVK